MSYNSLSQSIQNLNGDISEEPTQHRKIVRNKSVIGCLRTPVRKESPAPVRR